MTTHPRKAVTEMRRTATALLAVPLLLTGCSDTPPEVTDDDVVRIEESLAHGSELAWELTQAETRVASMCMQDEGFTVHDRNLMHGMMIPNRFEGFNSPYARVPTVEQAEKFAFGYWVGMTDTDEARAMREDLDYLAFAGNEMGWSDPTEYEEYEEWKALGEEYQREWLEAFHGPERLAYLESMSAGEDPVEAPPFGGCELETIEIVYGGPVHLERDWGSAWIRPDLESPLTWVGDGELYEELSAEYVDQEQDFLACVEDRGHGQWRFDDLGYLPVHWYAGQFYGDGTSYEGMEEDVPPLADAAEDAEDPVAFEFAMALDFAECAEDSGLRDGAEERWARMYVERLIDREAEVYAWEQEIEGYLADAQDYIAGK
ncbi:hypothetical protein LO763_22980 [Glycomyces sp. A-F 0318]|uniref:hypothetical protein n=1 Tax=Glycomyces amatae TaxID=2881355 RepID=UPI001E59C2E2|nr:hypothetical protein [Glycomyces amatae]MCD0446485.1 hypothetical protein [Glycomyces amatae]